GLTEGALVGGVRGRGFRVEAWRVGGEGADVGYELGLGQTVISYRHEEAPAGVSGDCERLGCSRLGAGLCSLNEETLVTRSTGGGGAGTHRVRHQSPLCRARSERVSDGATGRPDRGLAVRGVRGVLPLLPRRGRGGAGAGRAGRGDDLHSDNTALAVAH